MLDEDRMGLTLQFFAGQANSVLRAGSEIDLDYLDEFHDEFQRGKTCADFSLQITPRDLDLLTAEACTIRVLRVASSMGSGRR